jgi:hypothetical protein
MLTYKTSVILFLIVSSAVVPISTIVNSRIANITQLSPRVLFGMESSQPVQLTVSALANGTYQFCSQPDPRDWRDGVGVCFNFIKKDRAVDGYYGYPNSDNFVCVRGQTTGNSMVGKALAFSWPGQTWHTIPSAEFVWDTEGHLKLNQGAIRQQSSQDDRQESWIVFKMAKLDLSNFYRYDAPRMKLASELCNWD